LAPQKGYTIDIASVFGSRLIRRGDFFIGARFSDGAPHGEELRICHAIKPRRRPEKGKFGPILPIPLIEGGSLKYVVLAGRAGFT
jgi:hypothetical protein